MSELAIEYWPTDRPKDYPLNARKWSKQAIEKVAASIREYGFRQPIVVDTEGVIVIGHLRRRGAQSIGMPEVPVHVARDLTAEQIRGLRLADNRTHEEASWDLEINSAMALKAGLSDPDEVPAVQAEVISRPGDMWALGPHRLLCGDCTQKANVDRVLAGASPLLMVTDPPYGIELDSEWRDRAGLNGCGPAESSYMKHRTEGHTETSISGDTKADWSDAFALVPSLQVAYVWHASKFTREVLDGLLRIGFVHHQQIIWDKTRTVLTRTLYWFQHEPCWFVRKKNAPWYGKAGENSTIWSMPSPKFIMGGSGEEKWDHPTQKPIELMRKSILNHTTEGQAVFEPFTGSGTTLLACEQTGRLCYTLELDPKYVDVAVRRWQKFTGLEAALADGDHKGCTFEHAKEGRRRQWEDALMEEAIEHGKNSVQAN